MEILTRTFFNELEKIVSEYSEAMNEDDVAKKIEGIIPEIIPELVLLIKTSLLKKSVAMLEERRRLHSEFCERNIKRWQPAFDLLETFIVICTEVGENFNHSFRLKAVEKDDITFDIVVRHHARACHIAQEILCLLKNGFADGAHARWRALHEVTVTAMFVLNHGRECAERFYWHDIIESYYAMRHHRTYEHRLQARGPTDEEFETCKENRQQLLSNYGKSFDDPYGWASHIITGKRVTFADIEKEVGLDHMRPYYKWASQNIHAGPKGINSKLGLCETHEDILLVGPSNSGMTDPAHATAISLTQITSKLLTIEPNIDRVVLLRILSDMEVEIGELFLQCDQPQNS